MPAHIDSRLRNRCRGYRERIAARAGTAGIMTAFPAALAISPMGSMG